MRALLLFLDGVGLGADDPSVNPLAAARTPTLDALAGGRRWLRDTGRIETARARFIPTDPRLGVAGRPQSATGQAAIISGQNVPQRLGEHYGPYPNQAIRDILDETSLYKRLADSGRRGAYLDAYPPGFFAAVERGKRLRTSLQHAAHVGGVPLPGIDALRSGQALSADFTGEGWREMLNLPDVPVLEPEAAGARLASLAGLYDFAMFGTWITDEIGHRGPLERGVAFLERFDRVMAGLLDAWDDSQGLIILTSDHGNLEDVSIRQHTENDVPTVIIGKAKTAFDDSFQRLTDIAPRILRLLGVQDVPNESS